MSLGDRTITGFLAAIASIEPAPGAGAAGAVALALGLACARKAIAITLKHHPDEPALAGLAGHLAGLADQALAGGEADARCFKAYIAALQLPHDDPARTEAERDALTDLVAVGENLIAIGDGARAKLLAAKSDIAPSMINDIAAALALIAAARTIHTACVGENARALNLIV